MDNDKSWKTVNELIDENEKLRSIIIAQHICESDDEDGRNCPLYDEFVPYRCKLDRMLSELGLDELIDKPVDEPEGEPDEPESHDIGTATINVTPTLDWSNVINGLRELADILEGE